MRKPAKRCTLNYLNSPDQSSSVCLCVFKLRNGHEGAKTLAALNAREPRALFEQLRQARLLFIERICARRPANKKFLRGWLNRLNAITYEGLVL